MSSVQSSIQMEIRKTAARSIAAAADSGEDVRNPSRLDELGDAATRTKSAQMVGWARLTSPAAAGFSLGVSFSLF
jgi:hypothetical protein